MLSITLSKEEEHFKELFLRIIKPFNLIIGNKDLIIAYKVFNKERDKHKEIIDVIKDDYDITVVFKHNTPISKRKKILNEIINELRNAYKKELGVVAERMINFAIN